MIDKRVIPGEPLNIKASTWNTLLDTADHFRTRVGSGLKSVYSPNEASANTILIRNDSGTDLTAGKVLAIGDPLVLPSANEQAFINRAGFIGDTPSASDLNAVVLAVPIADGQIGFGYVDGLVPARIDLIAVDHDRCGLKSGSNVLETNEDGLCRIVWRESDTLGEMWAAVILSDTTTPAGSDQFGTWEYWQNNNNYWNYDGTVVFQPTLNNLTVGNERQYTPAWATSSSPPINNGAPLRSTGAGRLFEYDPTYDANYGALICQVAGTYELRFQIFWDVHPLPSFGFDGSEFVTLQVYLPTSPTIGSGYHRSLIFDSVNYHDANTKELMSSGVCLLHSCAPGEVLAFLITCVADVSGREVELEEAYLKITRLNPLSV